MTIRAIARDLYRARQKVEGLQKDLEAAASSAEREKLQGELRGATAELRTLQRILDGEKESASIRKKFQGFHK